MQPRDVVGGLWGPATSEGRTSAGRRSIFVDGETETPWKLFVISEGILLPDENIYSHVTGRYGCVGRMRKCRSVCLCTAARADCICTW